MTQTETKATRQGKSGKKKARRKRTLSDGMVFGCVLDGEGGAVDIDFDAACRWEAKSPDETLWLHLDRTVPGIDEWLRASLDICDATADVLISNETRPRAFSDGESLVTILRGVNLNKGARPEDMIAMQVYAVPGRIITLRRRKLQTPREVRASLEQGLGPKTTGDLFTELVEQLVIKINRCIIEMNERIDRLEAKYSHNLNSRATDKVVEEIAQIRRNCLALKRFMSPQHEALRQIAKLAPEWLSLHNRADIRETIDRLRRYLDDLDVSKESAIVLQDEINNRAANESNRTMYMLSIIAAIFLPMGFLTGLLGINVGGMPGVDSPDAFWLTVAMLMLLMVLQLYIFRKLKWL